MNKPFRDDGQAVAANKPLRLRRYDSSVGLPDPGECVDALIVVNDQADGVPRARLALSNGASWDFVAVLVDIPASTQQTVDIEPMVLKAVREVAPQLAAPRQALALPAPSAPDAGLIDRVRTLEMQVQQLIETIKQHERDLVALDARLSNATIREVA